MKVGFELLSAIPGKCGAVSNLWRNNLTMFPQVDLGIEYIVFVTKELFAFYEGILPKSDQVKFHICDLSKNSLTERIRFQEFGIPALLKSYKCDLFFTGTPTPTFNSRLPVEIFKITGIQFYSRPEEFGLARSFYHIFSTRRKAERSRYIVVNSLYVKQKIIARTNVSPENIEVIYESLDHNIFNQDKPVDACREAIVKKWGIDTKFLLFISDIRPYKNPLSLIKAFEQICKDLENYKLVMIGQDIAGYKKQLQEYIRQRHLEHHVIMFDYMEPFNFIYLMRTAEIFIYPSSLETFGTIPLEAMACGTPVIAGNETAIPEICGDAALLVDGKSSRAIADAIYKILGERMLRRKLIASGLQHVKKFSWQKNAEETVQLFKQAAGVLDEPAFVQEPLR